MNFLNIIRHYFIKSLLYEDNETIVQGSININKEIEIKKGLKLNY